MTDDGAELASLLSAEDAAFVADHANVIRRLAQRAVEDIIEIGERLTAVKRRIGHENWLPWLEREFGWSDQTARNYMAVTDAFKSQTVLNLPIDASALYLLAGKNVLEEARQEAVELAKSGERITRAEAREIVIRYEPQEPSPPVKRTIVIETRQEPPVERTVVVERPLRFRLVDDGFSTFKKIYDDTSKAVGKVSLQNGAWEAVIGSTIMRHDDEHEAFAAVVTAVGGVIAPERRPRASRAADEAPPRPPFACSPPSPSTRTLPRLRNFARESPNSKRGSPNSKSRTPISARPSMRCAAGSCNE